MTKQIAPTIYVPSGLVGRTPAAVLAELERRMRAGEIAASGGADSLKLITRGPQAGQYAIPVLLIQEPRINPWPRRRRIGAWIGASLAALVGLGWWAAATMGAVPLAALLLLVLALFGRRVYARHARQGVEVMVRVRVR